MKLPIRAMPVQTKMSYTRNVHMSEEHDVKI